MSELTKTGGDKPIVISMDPVTTFVTTVKVITSTVEAETSSEVSTQPPEVIRTTTARALLTSFDFPLPILTSTLTITHTEDEESSSMLSRTSPFLIPSTFQSTIGPVSPTSQPKPGLSVAASIGLGVSMGVIAFLVIAGVAYAVFWRYLRNLRRGSDHRTGATNGNRWWKARRRNSW